MWDIYKCGIPIGVGHLGFAMTNFKVKENSWIAKLAARKLSAHCVAIVIGHTIHLHNTTKENFIRNERWLKHELCHIRQFEKHGFFSFIAKYLWESAKSGYVMNKYEVEAREAEDYESQSYQNN